jgi:hypothetical protein
MEHPVYNPAPKSAPWRGGASLKGERRSKKLYAVSAREFFVLWVIPPLIEDGNRVSRTVELPIKGLTHSLEGRDVIVGEGRPECDPDAGVVCHVLAS